MANFSELDENNIVIRTVATNNDDPNGDEGYQWLIENLGGRWVQTSYHGNFRKNYGVPGSKYDEELDAFIPPKPFDSWILNEETCRWEAPVPMPTEGFWQWSEELGNWFELPTE